MGKDPTLTGTLSSFGHQVLSTRQSGALAKFGSSTRGNPYVNTIGGTSTGVVTRVTSGFGLQTSSRATTAPSHTFGNRYRLDAEMEKEGRPGPGTFEAAESIGRQPLSQKPTQPAWKVGTGGRFSSYKTIWKPDFETPGAGVWRPASGWLGDAPGFTFHGKAMRSTLEKGLPGIKPTCIEAPGPGQYEPPSSLGPQRTSTKQSAWRVRVGTANRDHIVKTQYLGSQQERALYGKHSPAPNAYDPRSGLSKTSKITTPPSFGFGSGDRFSQVKSRSGSPLPGPILPGPGSYVV